MKIGGASREFLTPGPTIAAFLADQRRIVGVMGPQGGGKTTGVIQKILTKAAMQPRSPVDGVARYRCVVWMDTYRNLWSKVIPDWLEWVPKDGPGREWVGARDNPAEHHVAMKVIEAGVVKIVKLEMWFRAIGEQTPQEAAKGIHTTDGWLPESTSATAEMRKALFGRLGRYPGRHHGGAPHRQLFCDWNAGDPYNWTTEYFVNSRPDNVGFHCQPGGREPNAENLHILVPGYYDEQIEANKDDPDWIRRMIDNKIGFMRDGKPVFEDFDATIHCPAAEIMPWRGVPLMIAADAGLTPALIIGQRNDFGESRLLHEIVADGKMGASEMGRELNRVLASERFKNVPPALEAYCDPAAQNPTEASQETETGELKSWMLIMSEITKIKWKPSRCNNSLTVRHDGVRHALRKRVQGRPGVQICAVNCPETVKALARDYRYSKVQVATQKGTEYREKPDKGKASHIGNACEYWFANTGEQAEVTGVNERRAAREAAARAQQKRRGPPRPADPLKAYAR